MCTARCQFHQDLSLYALLEQNSNHFLINPSPLSQSKIATLLCVHVNGKAFVHTLQDMCTVAILAKIPSPPKEKYQLHPNLLCDMHSPYVNVPSSVNVYNVMTSITQNKHLSFDPSNDVDSNSPHDTVNE